MTISMLSVVKAHGARGVEAVPAMVFLTGMASAACTGAPMSSPADTDGFGVVSCPVQPQQECDVSVSFCDSVLSSDAGLTVVHLQSELDTQKAYLSAWLCDVSASVERYAWAKNEQRSWNAGASVGVGPFSFGGNAGQSSNVLESLNSFEAWQRDHCEAMVQQLDALSASSYLSEVEDTTAPVKAWATCVSATMATYNACLQVRGEGGASAVQGLLPLPPETAAASVPLGSQFPVRLIWCGVPGERDPHVATIDVVAILGADCAGLTPGQVLRAEDNTFVCTRTGSRDVSVTVTVKMRPANGGGPEVGSHVSVVLPSLCGETRGSCCVEGVEDRGLPACSRPGDSCEGQPGVCRPAERVAGDLAEFDGIQYAFIPSGRVVMGSPLGEIGREDDEQEHTATITRTLWVGKSEVTQGQFFRVMQNNTAGISNRPSAVQDCDTCPVESVTWQEAALFLNELSVRAGLPKCFDSTTLAPVGDFTACLGYRLPSEAEWEFMARAGSTEAISGGVPVSDGPELDATSWYINNSGNQTHPVQLLAPNAWGLYDMHGNVWELVVDYYGQYAAGNVIDPTGPPSGTQHAMKGGGYGSKAVDLRCANRSTAPGGRRDPSLGFRIARTVGAS